MAGADAERPEAWTRAAWGLLALLLAAGLYLGSRPGGRAPVVVYRHAPWILFLGALGVLGWAAWTGLRRRPLLRPERLRPFVAVLLVFGAASYPLPYPSSHEGRPSTVRFRLPVEGEWTVLWGGDDRDANRLARFFPDRRWGLHLVRVRDGSTHVGRGAEPTDHHAWDRPVRAPAAGTVVAVRDGVPDAAPGTGGGDGLGNHVVLRVAEGEFCFVSNLRRGSVAVAPGEAVAAGTVVGRVGSSAASPVSPEPHVAVHLQDTPEPGWGEAIPWRFHGYRADGRAVGAGLPRGGIGPRGELLGQVVEDLGAAGPAAETGPAAAPDNSADDPEKASVRGSDGRD